MRLPILMRIPSEDFVEDQPLRCTKTLGEDLEEDPAEWAQSKGPLVPLGGLFTLSDKVLGTGLGAIQPCSC